MLTRYTFDTSWDRFDKMFESAFGVDHLWCDRLPIQEVSEDGKTITLRYDVPGFSKDDLQITLENGMLNIKGKKGKRKINSSWKVKESIEADDVVAKVENGELILTITRKTKSSTIKIT